MEHKLGDPLGPLTIQEKAAKAFSPTETLEVRVNALRSLQALLLKPERLGSSMSWLLARWPQFLQLLFSHPPPLQQAAALVLGSLGAWVATGGPKRTWKPPPPPVPFRPVRGMGPRPPPPPPPPPRAYDQPVFPPEGLLFDCVLPLLTKQVPLPRGDLVDAGEQVALIKCLQSAMMQMDAITFAVHAPRVLTAVLEVLEDENTSSVLLQPLVNLIMQICRYPSIINARFTDLVDVLLGWSLDPQLSPADRKKLTEAFKSLRPQWHQNRTLAVGLVSNLLKDMRALLDDKASRVASGALPRFVSLANCVVGVLRGSGPYGGGLMLQQLPAVVDVFKTAVCGFVDVAPGASGGGSRDLLQELCTFLIHLLVEMEKAHREEPMDLDPVLYQKIAEEVGQDYRRTENATAWWRVCAATQGLSAKDCSRPGEHRGGVTVVLTGTGPDVGTLEATGRHQQEVTDHLGPVRAVTGWVGGLDGNDVDRAGSGFSIGLESGSEGPSSATARPSQILVQWCVYYLVDFAHEASRAYQDDEQSLMTLYHFLEEVVQCAVRVGGHDLDALCAQVLRLDGLLGYLRSSYCPALLSCAADLTRRLYQLGGGSGPTLIRHLLAELWWLDQKGQEDSLHDVLNLRVDPRDGGRARGMSEAGKASGGEAADDVERRTDELAAPDGGPLRTSPGQTAGGAEAHPVVEDPNKCFFDSGQPPGDGTTEGGRGEGSIEGISMEGGVEITARGPSQAAQASVQGTEGGVNEVSEAVAQLGLDDSASVRVEGGHQSSHSQSAMGHIPHPGSQTLEFISSLPADVCLAMAAFDLAMLQWSTALDDGEGLPVETALRVFDCINAFLRGDGFIATRRELVELSLEVMRVVVVRGLRQRQEPMATGHALSREQEQGREEHADLRQGANQGNARRPKREMAPGKNEGPRLGLGSARESGEAPDVHPPPPSIDRPGLLLRWLKLSQKMVLTPGMHALMPSVLEGCSQLLRSFPQLPVTGGWCGVLLDLLELCSKCPEVGVRELVVFLLVEIVGRSQGGRTARLAVVERVASMALHLTGDEATVVSRAALALLLTLSRYILVQKRNEWPPALCSGAWRDPISLGLQIYSFTPPQLGKLFETLFQSVPGMILRRVDDRVTTMSLDPAILGLAKDVSRVDQEVTEKAEDVDKLLDAYQGVPDGPPPTGWYNLVETWWVMVQEAAKTCVNGRMRTHLGGPTQSFVALDQLLQGVLTRVSTSERGLGLDGLPWLVLEFMMGLEQGIYTAIDGCQVRAAPVTMATTFFFSNSRVCDEWFSRARTVLLNISYKSQCWQHVVYHSSAKLADLRLQLRVLMSQPGAGREQVQGATEGPKPTVGRDPKEGNKDSGDHRGSGGGRGAAPRLLKARRDQEGPGVGSAEAPEGRVHGLTGKAKEEALEKLGQVVLEVLCQSSLALCRLNDPDGVEGLQVWAVNAFAPIWRLASEEVQFEVTVEESTDVLNWMAGVIKQAQGRFEEAAQSYSLYLKSPLARTALGSYIYSHVVDRLVDCYSALSDARRLKGMLKDLRSGVLKDGGGRGSKTLESELIHKLAEFCEVEVGRGAVLEGETVVSAALGFLKNPGARIPPALTSWEHAWSSAEEKLMDCLHVGRHPPLNQWLQCCVLGDLQEGVAVAARAAGDGGTDNGRGRGRGMTRPRSKVNLDSVVKDMVKLPDVLFDWEYLLGVEPSLGQYSHQFRLWQTLRSMASSGAGPLNVVASRSRLPCLELSTRLLHIRDAWDPNKLRAGSRVLFLNALEEAIRTGNDSLAGRLVTELPGVVGSGGDAGRLALGLVKLEMTECVSHDTSHLLSGYCSLLGAFLKPPAARGLLRGLEGLKGPEPPPSQLLASLAFQRVAVLMAPPTAEAGDAVGYSYVPLAQWKELHHLAASHLSPQDGTALPSSLLAASWVDQGRLPSAACHTMALALMPTLGESWLEYGNFLFIGTQKARAAAKRDILKEEAPDQSSLEGYVLAVQAYCRYLALAGGERASEDHVGVLLRILQVVLRHGHVLYDQLLPSLSSCPGGPWSSVITQLFSQLGQPQPVVRSLLQLLLTRLAAAAPSTVLYPVAVDICAARGAGEQPTPEIQAIMHELEAKQPGVVDHCCEFIRELEHMTVLPQEKWHSLLADLAGDMARRMISLEADAQRMEADKKLAPEQKESLLMSRYSAVMAPVIMVLEKNLQTSRATAPVSEAARKFADDFLAKVDYALEALRHPRVAGSDGDRLSHCWDKFKVLQQDLGRFIKQTQLDLSDLSPKLASKVPSGVPVPSQEALARGGYLGPSVVSLQSCVTVMSTKTRPKRIIMVGSDGCEYGYLLKGREDLRMDERFMQVLRVVNSILTQAKSNVARGLNARHYSVVPLGLRMGLIQWVPQTRSFFSLYRSWVQGNIDRLAAVVAGKQGADGAPQPAEAPSKRPRGAMELMVRPAALFYSKLLPALQEAGLPGTAPRKEWPPEVLRGVLTTLMRGVPRHLFARELLLGSPHGTSWYQRTHAFGTSLAVMSMVGYVLGLGDRHLDNILLDEASGGIVHIDYNVGFDKGARLKVPEIVPFRLTQTFQGALGVTGVEGTFRKACERVMAALRDQRATLALLLDAVVTDPLVDWSLDKEVDAARSDMEVAVSLNLFVTRVDEVRGPLVSHIEEAMPKVLSALEVVGGFFEVHAYVTQLTILEQQGHDSLAEAQANLQQAQDRERESVAQIQRCTHTGQLLYGRGQHLSATIMQLAHDCHGVAEGFERALEGLGDSGLNKLSTSPDVWQSTLAPTPLALMAPRAEWEGLLPQALGPLAGSPWLPAGLLQQCAVLDHEGGRLLVAHDETVTLGMTSLLQYSLVLRDLLPPNYHHLSYHWRWYQVFSAALSAPTLDALEHARELVPKDSPGELEVLGVWIARQRGLQVAASAIQELEVEVVAGANKEPGGEGEVDPLQQQLSELQDIFSDDGMPKEALTLLAATAAHNLSQEAREKLQGIWASLLHSDDGGAHALTNLTSATINTTGIGGGELKGAGHQEGKDLRINLCLEELLKVQHVVKSLCSAGLGVVVLPEGPSVLADEPDPSRPPNVGPGGGLQWLDHVVLMMQLMVVALKKLRCDIAPDVLPHLWSCAQSQAGGQPLHEGACGQEAGKEGVHHGEGVGVSGSCLPTQHWPSSIMGSWVKAKVQEAVEKIQRILEDAREVEVRLGLGNSWTSSTGASAGSVVLQQWAVLEEEMSTTVSQVMAELAGEDTGGVQEQKRVVTNPPDGASEVALDPHLVMSGMMQLLAGLRPALSDEHKEGGGAAQHALTGSYLPSKQRLPLDFNKWSLDIWIIDLISDLVHHASQARGPDDLSGPEHSSEWFTQCCDWLDAQLARRAAQVWAEWIDWHLGALCSRCLAVADQYAGFLGGAEWKLDVTRLEILVEYLKEQYCPKHETEGLSGPSPQLAWMSSHLSLQTEDLGLKDMMELDKDEDVGIEEGMPTLVQFTDFDYGLRGADEMLEPMEDQHGLEDDLDEVTFGGAALVEEDEEGDLPSFFSALDPAKAAPVAEGDGHGSREEGALEWGNDGELGPMPGSMLNLAQQRCCDIAGLMGASWRVAVRKHSASQLTSFQQQVHPALLEECGSSQDIRMKTLATMEWLYDDALEPWKTEGMGAVRPLPAGVSTPGLVYQLYMEKRQTNWAAGMQIRLPDRQQLLAQMRGVAQQLTALVEAFQEWDRQCNAIFEQVQQMLVQLSSAPASRPPADVNLARKVLQGFVTHRTTWLAGARVHAAWVLKTCSDVADLEDSCRGGRGSTGEREAPSLSELFASYEAVLREVEEVYRSLQAGDRQMRLAQMEAQAARQQQTQALYMLQVAQREVDVSLVELHNHLVEFGSRIEAVELWAAEGKNQVEELMPLVGQTIGDLLREFSSTVERQPLTRDMAALTRPLLSNHEQLVGCLAELRDILAAVPQTTASISLEALGAVPDVVSVGRVLHQQLAQVASIWKDIRPRLLPLPAQLTRLGDELEHLASTATTVAIAIQSDHHIDMHGGEGAGAKPSNGTMAGRDLGSSSDGKLSRSTGATSSSVGIGPLHIAAGMEPTEGGPPEVFPIRNLHTVDVELPEAVDAGSEVESTGGEVPQEVASVPILRKAIREGEPDAADGRLLSSRGSSKVAETTVSGSAVAGSVTSARARDSASSRDEKRKVFAVNALRRCLAKIDGSEGDKTLSVAEHVDQLIRQATNLDLLSRMYEGWTAWI